MKNVLIAVLLALTIAGCKRDAIIQNYPNEPVVRYDNRELSMQEVEQAIVVAGADLGWNMQRVEDGQLVAILDVRGKHQAVVDVRYDTDSYSLTYRDSSNLRFQPPNQIHRRYNGWVANLKKNINAKIQSIR